MRKTHTVVALLCVGLFCGCSANRSNRIPHTEEDPDAARDNYKLAYASELARASAAIKRQDHAAAAAIYADLVDKGVTGKDADVRNSDDVEYNAARCYALAGDADVAFDFLLRSLATAPYGHLRRDPDFLNREPDFAPLRASPKWAAMIDKLAAERVEQAALKTVHPRLYELYKHDQMDRHFGKEWRDRERRVELEKLLEAGQVSTAEDHYIAALLHMHGDGPASYLKAGTLAREAVRLGSRRRHARWIIASAQDRYLLSIGKPQWYGTQIQHDKDGMWTLEPIDETAVTDAQRRELGVPSLADLRRPLELRNRWWRRRNGQ